MRTRPSRRTVKCALVLLAAGTLRAQTAAGPPLADRVQAIISRPEFRHATFGIEFYSLDTNQPVYALNEQQLFTPASTTKLLTEGTALALLGADYRFHTRVYRSGPLAADGTLEGDLIVEASGDPNLSNRIQADGTLAFENEDHSYGGSPDTRALPGDPLAVLRQMAAQVAAKGVKRVTGRIRIDLSLFPEGEAELGTGDIISPIVVNDNVIDVTAHPGAHVGDPVTLTVSPATAYARFVGDATTGPADSKPDIKWAKDLASPDGTRTVVATGNMPAGGPPILYSYDVPQPSRFAEIAFTEALSAAGVEVKGKDVGTASSAFAGIEKPENLVAEHVSPPLSEDIRITLKVSENLHASTMLYLVGAVAGHATQDAEQKGFDLEHDFLVKAGLDLSGASQSDGAGGAEAAFYTPDFMVHYLAYYATRPDFPVLFRGLPILGRDGTLWNIQTTCPAAGQVHAKTGTYDAYDALNRNLMVTGKGLAGYFTTPAGRRFAFAAYANRVAVPSNEDAATRVVGQALGQIADAGYEALSEEYR